MLSEFLNPLTARFNETWAGLHNIEQSIVAILMMAVAYYFVRYIVIRRIEKLTAKTENDLDDRLIHFIKQFLWLVVLLGTLVLVLKINGIAISPILAGAGIFGVAVGFAAKETIADILSGIFLIVPVRLLKTGLSSPGKLMANYRRNTVVKLAT